ncbi:sensor histidine kinase [Mobilicoccus caccae]|uniref:histidine kinase n=1 Tax=Mobilicoccus caccae TaxID=1859295 RepID=A0ABQ6ILE8_9MICO|nr:HAMP domain-containing sensor histidine kinase [Mobilicoccus caccae]GMA38754.1 two-component sensor histidine kinase [Mobilicoccus caccae]
MPADATNLPGRPPSSLATSSPSRTTTRARGLRARIVAITTGLLAAVLLVGAIALSALVVTMQRSALDAELRQTAQQIATLVAENRVPATLPVSGARLVQVVDPTGAVVSASPAADRLTPLLAPAELATARGGKAVEVSAGRVAESGRLRAVALPAGPASRQATVITASDVGDLADTQRGLWLGLAGGVPLVLLVAAVLAWRAVGAALRPVDALRAGAERIGAGGEGEAESSGERTRLPVPVAQDEIRALAVTLNGMLDRLDEAAAGRRRFIADAAHELRSPVASLRMQVEVAARLDPDDELAAELLPDVERLSRLVDDLLLLARAGSAQTPYRPEPLDPVELAAGVVARFVDARVPVSLESGSGATVVADASALERALVNLLENAVRHAETRVDVRVQPADGHVAIEVCDDGVGIAESDRERVFERFTRLDEARARDSGGSGLGLSIVRELVRREGGEVSLHDNVGDPHTGRTGLRARIVLPPADAGR